MGREKSVGPVKQTNNMSNRPGTQANKFVKLGQENNYQAGHKLQYKMGQLLGQAESPHATLTAKLGRGERILGATLVTELAQLRATSVGIGLVRE